ncbi:AI-2E family transporter [Mangrovibacillus cuniculi]|uniref:AI-2E family transporter n=1 Tax=Mangrovibacillus cuniculi TaxID=2593652 RepID=UPI001EFA20BE|nr:AI-2E family transporter [Mangrovibacillus cuniculi]
MKKSKLQFWLIQILLLLAIIFVGSQVSFFLQPIAVFFSTLFFPILVAGLLYYLLNPLVNLLSERKVPRLVSILIVFLSVIGIVVLVVRLVAPTISEQINQLVNDIPKYADQVVVLVEDVANSTEYEWMLNQDYVKIEDVEETVVNYAETLPQKVVTGVSAIFGFVTSFAVIVVTVPFLLFYLMKDGHRIPNNLAKLFPLTMRHEILRLLRNTSQTLASYIQGQVIVSLFVGTLAFIGYLIIDLRYALVLAIIVVFTNIIPFVGPIIGGAPAVIVGFFESPTQGLLALLVITIAQQLEGNVLSPLILGKSLQIHPATIIIVLLVAGNIAGVLGMLLGYQLSP